RRNTRRRRRSASPRVDPRARRPPPRRSARPRPRRPRPRPARPHAPPRSPRPSGRPGGPLMTHSDILIQCRDLTREYRKGDNTIRPLDGLQLDVPRSDFLALMGPSGSGKTTLLNLIAGIDTPTSGSLVIDGQDIAKLGRSRLAAWRSANVGYIFQLYNLVPVLTAFENVELPLLLQPMSRSQRRDRVMECLDLVGIADRADHFPRQLS